MKIIKENLELNYENISKEYIEECEDFVKSHRLIESIEGVWELKRQRGPKTKSVETIKFSRFHNTPGLFMEAIFTYEETYEREDGVKGTSKNQYNIPLNHLISGKWIRQHSDCYNKIS